MISYQRFQFANPPRTATTWFLRACHMAGLGEGFKAHAHNPPPEGYNGFVVSFVRHPVEWLQSYYSALKGGAVGVSCVDTFCWAARESKDFHTFVRKYLKHHPGDIGMMFDAYKANTVLRVEDLPYNAVEFFQSLGVKKDRLDKIKQLDPQNICSKKAHTKHSRLRERVCEAEADFCDRYEYDIWS